MMPGTCEAISAELVAFLDGELADGERRPIATHVSTCLACRREIERLTTIRGWVSDLPCVEPSATFAETFWQRLELETGGVTARPAPSRRWWWTAPALAAAAAVALAFQFFTGAPPTTSTAPAPPAKIVAAERPAAARPAEVAGAPKAAKAEPPATVADAGALNPEDVPPELLEHPELFLRLPVVRRLEKLEHFEEVRQAPVGDEGGAG